MREKLDIYLAELRSSLRFRWQAVLVAWIVCLLGWLAVYLLPSRYDTTARVYVDTNTLLRPLLEGLAVNPNNINEVDMLRRALLARPQLERVINDAGLRSRVRSDVDLANLVSDLSTKIRITGDPESRLYTISYGDNDPRVSHAVVRELLDLFVGESIGAKRADAETAQKFLGEQIKEVEQRLTTSESRLAEFKKKNVGYMPDDRGGYFERLQREMQEVDRLEAAMSVAQNKRTELRGKLLGGNQRDSNSTQPVALETSVDTRLAEARQRLDDMLLRFTDNHPDVIALREAINSLEQLRTSELAMMRSAGGALGTPRSGQTNLVLQNLQIGLNDVEVEIASTQSQLTDHRKRINELRANMNVLPEVEAELARLSRDYGINRTQYESLLQRLESARLTDQADRSDELKFRVIDPPVLPLTPASPKRALMVLGVLFAGLLAGGAFAWLLSMLKPVFSSLSQVRAAFNGRMILGSLSELPPMTPQSRFGAAQRRGVTLGLAVLGLFVACGALVAVQSRADSFRQTVIGWIA